MDSKIEPVAWEKIAVNMRSALISMQVGGCTCGTKSPTLEYHDIRCRYRQAAELDGVLETLTDEFAAALLAAEQRGRESERERCAKIAEDEDGNLPRWGEDRNQAIADTQSRANELTALRQRVVEWHAARNATLAEPVADVRKSETFRAALNRLANAEDALAGDARALVNEMETTK